MALPHRVDSRSVPRGMTAACIYVMTDSMRAGIAKPNRQENSQEIEIDKWVWFLAEFTRLNRGAHARLEELGVDDVGYVVETENRPFDGISADVKDGERIVWISFGGTADDHHTHGVHRAKGIRVLLPGRHRGSALEVEAEDGTRTVLELSRPEAYALPPAQSREDKV